MKNKNSDINKKALRQSISWTCINKQQWRKLNALQGHCFEKRSKSKNRNINQKLTNLNVSEIFEDVEKSKKKIKAVKIKGGLQPYAATHTAFIVHAGNSENQLNREEAAEYFSEVITWLKKNLRGSLLHYSMHFDETTPHVHIMFENLEKTAEGNFCSFRSLMNFRNQPKKTDREGLEFFVRRLHKDVSKKFGFLEPRRNQEVRTLDEYKQQQKATLEETIETLKQQQQEQQQQEQEQEQTLREIKEKQEQTLREIKEQELKLKTKEQQEQELKLKEQELKLKQKEQQEQEQELKRKELKLKEQEQRLKDNWKKQKKQYEDNIERLKENWKHNKNIIRTKIEKKVEEIATALLTESNIDMMLEKEIKLLNGITEKLKQATTQEEKRTLIENILKVKQQKLIRLKKGKDKNKEAVIEEIKQEQKQIKKAKRELSR